MRNTTNKKQNENKREKRKIVLFITSGQYADISRIGNKAGCIPDKRNKAIHKCIYLPVNINVMFRLYCSLLRIKTSLDSK